MAKIIHTRNTGRIIILLLILLCCHSVHSKDDALAKIRSTYFMKKVNDSALAVTERIAYLDSVIDNTGTGDIATLSALWHRKGDMAFDCGMYPNAIEAYRNVMKHSSKSPVNESLEMSWRLGMCYLYLGRYEKTISEACAMIEKAKPDSLRYYDVKGLLLLSNVQLRLGKTEMAMKYINDAQKMLSKCVVPESQKNELTCRLHLGASGINIMRKDMEKAFAEIEKARKYGVTPELSICIDMNLAIIYSYMGEYDIAEEYYRKILDSDMMHYNKIIATNNYILFSMSSGQLEKALKMCDRNMPLINEFQMWHAKSNLYTIKSLIYVQMNNYKRAYECQDSAMVISLRMFNADNEEKIDELITQFETFSANREEEAMQKVYFKKNVTILLLIVSLAISTIAIYLLRQRNRKQRASKKMLETRIETIEQDHKKEMQMSSEELEIKNRELTTYAMRMAQVNDLLNKILANKDQLAGTGDPAIAGIINDIKSLKLQEISWDTFKVYFEQIHHSFFIDLQRAHPNLTAGETRMCAFIIMHLSTKDIATLTNRSVRTVETIKYRLGKKLNLPEGVTLATYLCMLAGTATAEEGNDEPAPEQETE